MRFYRGRAIKLDYYRKHRSAYSKKQEDEPSQDITSPGCTIGCLSIVLFFVGMLFLPANGDRSNITLGYLTLWLSLIAICAVGYLIYKISFFVTYSKPLSEDEILQLAEKKMKKSVRDSFEFKLLEDVCPKKDFKSSLNPEGEFYECDIRIASFPTYVARLLKGKKHEWVVLAVCDDNFAKGFWANKGFDRTEVSFGCSIDYICKKAETLGCNTIMCFHNHPNRNPNYLNCLVASEQDKKSAMICSLDCEAFGKSWIDFVCERGQFLKYYQNIVWGNYKSDFYVGLIKQNNNVSRLKNVALHKEFQKLGCVYRTDEKSEPDAEDSPPTSPLKPPSLDNNADSGDWKVAVVIFVAVILIAIIIVWGATQGAY